MTTLRFLDGSFPGNGTIQPAAGTAPGLPRLTPTSASTTCGYYFKCESSHKMRPPRLSQRDHDPKKVEKDNTEPDSSDPSRPLTGHSSPVSGFPFRRGQT